MNKTSVALVLFSVIALASAQCSCQSKSPVDVKYPGEACECTRQYPVQMQIPKVTEHRDAHYDYGFTIERPQEAPQEVKYTFDFHMEKPKPIPTASLATYAFEVQKPVEKPDETPQRYSFDYKIQTPVVAKSPSNLEGLMAHVDKVVIQKQDCQDKNSCQCSSYKPTIDLLQRCPTHGHLYRSGGLLHPDQQRYNTDFRSIEQPITYVAIASSDRPKRNVANPLQIKIQGLLPGLRPNNQILKKPESVEDKNQIRIEQIMKKNFGEDPVEDIEELLKPKPLTSTQKIDAEKEKGEVAVESTPVVTAEFLSKIKPKLDKARANFRRQISKIVNRARLDAIKANNHVMQKRETESDSSNEGEYLPDTFAEKFEPIWIADVSVEDQGTENKIESKSIADDGEPIANTDRFRKHCDRCNELAKKFPCPSCGHIPQEAPPQIVQTNEGNPIRYAPEFQSQPRYVSDRMTADDTTVGSFYSQPAYGELQDILSKNSGAIHLQNRRVEQGHLLQPMDFEHASDAIRFIQELTQRNNQYNEDYYSNRNSHDAGASAQNIHSKRSFKIVPLAEKDDGSVFVKISPVEGSTWDVESKINKKSERPNPSSSNRNSKDNDTNGTSQMASKANENGSFGSEHQKTNMKKFVRNGKQYEVLALNDSSDDESTGSLEDLEILKYIYEVNQKGAATDNASEGNHLTNSYAQVET